MPLNPVQMEKRFNIKISESKVYEIITRIIYQPRQPIISSNITHESKEKKIMRIFLGNLILLFKMKEMLNKKVLVLIILF